MDLLNPPAVLIWGPLGRAALFVSAPACALVYQNPEWVQPKNLSAGGAQLAAKISIVL
jgi:hypothetical protein